jgi:hypothetical protein
MYLMKIHDVKNKKKISKKKGMNKSKYYKTEFALYDCKAV